MKKQLLLVLFFVFIVSIKNSFSQDRISGVGEYKLGETTIDDVTSGVGLLRDENGQSLNAKIYSIDYYADSLLAHVIVWQSYIEATTSSDISDVELYFLNDTLYSLKFSPSKEFLEAFTLKFGSGKSGFWQTKNITAKHVQILNNHSRQLFSSDVDIFLLEVDGQFLEMEREIESVEKIVRSIGLKYFVKALQARREMIGYNKDKFIITDLTTNKKANRVKVEFDQKTKNEKVKEMYKKL